MKQRYIIGLTIFLLFLGWRLFFAETPEKKSEQEASNPPLVSTDPSPLDEVASGAITKKRESKDPQIQKPRPAPQAKVLKVDSPQPSVKPGQRRSLPKGAVEFEVLPGGYAVAFGDILLGKVKDKTPGKDRGLFKPATFRLWESPTMAFHIEKDLPNKMAVEQALEYLETYTVLRFVNLQNQEDGLAFVPGEERCLSYVGRVGGIQPVFLSPECGRNEILHEILHALGFVHEQSRVDRDEFVRILWENIDEPFFNQFDLIPAELTSRYYKGASFDFDYTSRMMYHPTAFAKQPGQITIESLTSTPIAPISEGLSQRDIDRINSLFGH